MADAKSLDFGGFGRERLEDELELPFGDAFIWDLTEDNPTDEPCDFCDQPEQDARSAFDLAVPIAEGRVALKGALGMMRPGYMLGITREHVTSFAQLSMVDLVEVDEAFSDCEEQLRHNLGYDGYIRLEHGSDNLNFCGAGACVIHAHQHLIPGTEATAARLLDDDKDWQQLDSFTDLAGLKGSSYLYVAYNGEHHAVIDPAIPSQWGRRIIAAEDGHDEWDWAIFSGAMNLMQTFIALNRIPRGRMLLHTDGAAEFFPPSNPYGKGPSYTELIERTSK